MDWKRESKSLLIIAGLFLICFYLPVGNQRFDKAVLEALGLVQWYAKEHVLLCLIPAFFIAGAISVFISQASVMKYLGVKANKVLAYSVASVSGSVLAVCSCTVLPLFAGIYKMGAGLGPACAFLYSGPAINVLAIILTVRVLGLELGLARALGAILFSVAIGIAMHWLFRKEELEKEKIQAVMPDMDVKHPLFHNAIHFALMVIILVLVNWSSSETTGFFGWIAAYKWMLASIFAGLFALVLVLWFEIKVWKMALAVISVIIASFLAPQTPLIPFAVGLIGLSLILISSQGEREEWFISSWTFAKQIMPLLFWGVLIAGFLLGRPDSEGMIPSSWITSLVGGNSLASNFFASIVGAFMYFATLTEIPILQGLISGGMGKGPALALLLAGPALSLPNMLVIRNIMGNKKTAAYIVLVIIMSTASGLLFGWMAG
jgi:uncharacterized protein